MYANPVVINGVMYISTPSLKAVALDAATGRQLWAFDPAKYGNGEVARLRNRGVAYWKVDKGERIFDSAKDRSTPWMRNREISFSLSGRMAISTFETTSASTLEVWVWK